MRTHRLRRRYGRSSDASHGRFDPPRRLQIMSSESTYLKKGQFAYALSFDERGGNYPIDKKGPVAPGERVYLISKTKDVRGGALWITAGSVRFTGRNA